MGKSTGEYRFFKKYGYVLTGKDHKCRAVEAGKCNSAQWFL